MLESVVLAGDSGSRDVLVVGPSLGTSVDALWGECSSLLGGCQVLGWDLPGHGRSVPAEDAFTVADLAREVRALATAIAAGRPVAYAGVSLGGAVGFELALDAGPFRRIATIASAPRIGTPAGWRDRAALVRGNSTGALLDATPARWFAPGFVDRRPEISGALLAALAATDDESYALACDALAEFDRTGLLAGIDVPLLACAGEVDAVVPPDQVERAAAGARGASFEMFAGCAHLPPAEDPAAVASTLRRFLELP